MAEYKQMPNGDVVEIPTNPQDRARLQRYVQKKYGVDILERSIAEQAGEFAKAVPRGALTTLLDAPLGIASLLDVGDDSDVVAGLRELKKGIREDSPLAVNPVYSDQLSTKFGEGLGSFFPFLGAGKVGQALQKGRPMAPGFKGYLQSPSFLAPATLAVPTGFSAQAERVQESRDMGEDVSGFQETLATLFGGVGGASEVLPITALFKRIPKSALQDETVKQMITRRLASAARGGFAEGAQEVAAGIYQDLVARGIYSDNLPIGASAYDDFTIGGLVGGTVDLVATSMADRRNRAAGNYIKTDADKAEQNKEQAKIDAQQNRNIIPVPVDVGPPPQFSFTQNTDGTFSIIDIADPTTPIEQAPTEAEALAKIDQIYTQYSLNKSKQVIDNLLYIKGLTQSSVAGEIAQKQLDQNLTTIDLKAIASYDSKFKDKNIAELQKGESETAKRYNLNNEGIKNRYTFAEAQKILNPIDFSNLVDTYVDTIYNNTLTRNKSAELSSTFFGKEPLFAEAQKIAGNKNIILNNNDTINRFIKNVTGADNFNSATPAQKRLFIAHLNDLGTFNEETNFPDFIPRDYQAEDVSKFVTEFIDTPFTKGVVESRFGKNADAFISDLVESGRAVADGNTYTINKNYETDIARRAEGFNESPEAFRDRLIAEGILPPEAIEKLYGQEKSKQAFIEQAGYTLKSPFKARDTRPLRIPARKATAADRPGVYDSDTLRQDLLQQDRLDILNIFRISETSNRYLREDVKEATSFLTKLMPNLPKDYRLISEKVLATMENLKNNGYTFDISPVSWARRAGQENPFYLKADENSSGFGGGVAGFASTPINSRSRSIIIGLNDMPGTRPKGKLRSVNGVNYETIVHELIHAATVAQIRYVGAGNGTVKQKADFKRYDNLRKEAKAAYRKRAEEYVSGERSASDLRNEPILLQNYVAEIKQYGMKSANEYHQNYLFNSREFITWGTTSRKFQQLLESMKSKARPQKSLWNEFVETVRRILNLPAKTDTMLSRLLRVSNDILDLPPVPLMDNKAYFNPDLSRASSLSIDANRVDPNKLVPPFFFLRDLLKNTNGLGLTRSQKRSLNFKQDKVNIEVDELQLLRDWVAGDLSKKIATEDGSVSYGTDTGDFIKMLSEDTPFKVISQAYLNSIADGDGNITVYRALNLGQGGGSKLLTEKSIASVTLDPNVAFDMAQKESVKKVMRYREGYTPPQFMTDFDRQLAIAEGDIIIEEIKRKPVVVEYKVPIENIEGYLPAIYASMSDRVVQEYASQEADLTDGYEIDELVEEEGYDRYDAIEEIARQKGYADDVYYDLDIITKEAEAIVNFDGKFEPTNVYNLEKGQRAGDVLTDEQLVDESSISDFDISSTDYGFVKGKRSNKVNTSEKAKLDSAVQEATDINEKTVVGNVPVYNTAASDIAIKAAIDFNNDPSAKAPTGSVDEGSTGTIPDAGLNSRINATMGKKVTNKSIPEQVLDFMQSPFTNIRKWFKDFRTNFIDAYDPIVKATKDQVSQNKEIERLEANAVSSAIKTIRLAEKYRAIFKQMLTIGHVRSVVTDENGNVSDAGTNVGETVISTKYNPGFKGDTGTGGFMQFTAPLYMDSKVDKERIWGYYERVKRDQDIKNRRNPDGTLSNPDYKSPFDERDIANIRKIEQEYPEIVEVSNNYQAWNNSLVKFAQEKGLLNKEQAEKWIAESSYFPFYRQMVEDEGVRGPRIAVGSLPNNPLNIKLKGGESEIDSDPVESVMKNSMSILAASMKNDGVTKLIRNFEINGQARKIDKKEAVGNPNVIFAFKDGQKEFYEVDDIELFNALENFGGITMDPLVKFISLPSRLLRETVTRDPGFIAVNILRDTLSSAVTSGSDFVPIIDSVKNMFGDISQLERFGVISGYDFANDEGDVKNFLMKEFRKQGINTNNSMTSQNLLFKVWDGLGDLTTKSDGATRKAVYDDVYKKLKDAGRTEGEAQSEAAYQALEIINFGRRGNSVLWKIITSGIPFLNARVQGLDVLYRGFTGQYSAIEGTYKNMTQEEIKAEIQKKALLRGAFLTSLTFAYYMLMSDEEEYKNLRREVRDDNWIIPTPFDYSVKIPIPFEVGMLFKAIPERFFDMTIGEERFTRPAVDDFLTSTARQLGTSANIPFFQPGAGIQILKPFTEAFITNRNTYTGQEIVPYYKQGLLPAYQATERTNELARVIGEAFNISPAKLEHAMRGYTGTLGSYVLLLADQATRQVTGSPSLPSNIKLVPVLNRLIMDTDRSGGGLQQQFYELRSEVNEAVQTMNKLQQENRLDELATYRADMLGVSSVKESVRRLDKYLSDWRERRRKLLQSNMDPTLKAELLQQLEFERDQRLAMVPLLRKQANIPVTQFFN